MLSNCSPIGIIKNHTRDYKFNVHALSLYMDILKFDGPSLASFI